MRRAAAGVGKAAVGSRAAPPPLVCPLTLNPFPSPSFPGPHGPEPPWAAARRDGEPRDVTARGGGGWVTQFYVMAGGGVRGDGGGGCEEPHRVLGSLRCVPPLTAAPPSATDTARTNRTPNPASAGGSLVSPEPPDPLWGAAPPPAPQPGGVRGEPGAGGGAAPDAAVFLRRPQNPHLRPGAEKGEGGRVPPLRAHGVGRVRAAQLGGCVRVGGDPGGVGCVGGVSRPP